MKLWKNRIWLRVLMLCAIATGLSAGEVRQPRPFEQRQGKLLEGITPGGAVEEIEGIGKISGPWLGRRGFEVADTLSIFDVRFGVETELGEQELLVALQECILLRYFSDPGIKVISKELRYPGSSFHVIYYEGGWLGQFTLSLRDADGGFKAWIVDHSQAQPNINEAQLGGMDIEKSLADSKRRREEIIRESAERMRAAKEEDAAVKGQE